MSPYVAFHVYLIMSISSVVFLIMEIGRKNIEKALTMLIILLMSFIGLMCNYSGWLRTYQTYSIWF